jgi:uncharacterized phage protein gp47/JayE
MAYTAPTITDAGLVLPTYQDLEDFLTQETRRIFGEDIYLENDSQDFQDIASRALVLYQMAQLASIAYASRSPVTAVGAALDGVVALNGISRKPATPSTASVTLTGTPFTVINNGVVVDINGNAWDLPSSVTIGASGTVTVLATCQTDGPVTALAGQINIISTPILGWASVINPNAATPGQQIETDAALRVRYAASVANPSQALTTGILGGVLSVEGVAAAQLYENDTGSTVNTINGVFNPNGYPRNSITLVVNGGSNQDIANAIAVRKTPGCYTNGDQSVVTYDQYGVPTTIRFYRPNNVTINVEMNLKPLSGYSSEVGEMAKQAVVDYLLSLPAGQSVIISELWQAVLSIDKNTVSPSFSLLSLTAAKQGDAQGTTDITLNFNQEAYSTTANVSVTAIP